jgi:hypothetical protein
MMTTTVDSMLEQQLEAAVVEVDTDCYFFQARRLEYPFSS